MFRFCRSVLSNSGWLCDEPLRQSHGRGLASLIEQLRYRLVWGWGWGSCGGGWGCRGGSGTSFRRGISRIHRSNACHSLVDPFRNCNILPPLQIGAESLRRNPSRVDVFLRITARGFRVLPQHEVAGYRIDLVVDGMERRVAVECDGDRWHGPEWHKEDVARQRMLERCGWKFWRVRGSAFSLDPDRALDSLW